MKKVSFLIMLFLVALLRWFASDYYFQKLVNTNRSALSSSNLTAYIQEILLYSPTESKLLVGSGEWQGKILLSARNLPELVIGQQISMQNSKITLWDDLQAGSFKNYLLLKNVWAQGENGQIKPLNQFKKDWRYYIYQIHSVFNKYLLKKFSSDVSGVFAGVLFGDTNLLSSEAKNSFRITGLGHVMAISGANMTLIAQTLFRLLFFLSLRKRIIICITLLTIFTLFVGASAAVIRALIMAIVVLLSLWFNLPYLALRALFLVCFLMYFWNPYIVLYDVGFHLSVAATYGLLIALRPMNSVFYWVPWKSVKELLVITLSATIFTAPVILYYFGSISFLSPIVNLLLVPLLAYLSILGYPIIVMTVLPFIGDSISLLTDYCLRYILSLVTYLAILAESAVFVVNLSFWLLLVWLGILIKVFLILNKRFH